MAEPMPFLRCGSSGPFGIVVIHAGGAVDRHPDLLLPPALTLCHPPRWDPSLRSLWPGSGRPTSSSGRVQADLEAILGTKVDLVAASDPSPPSAPAPNVSSCRCDVPGPAASGRHPGSHPC